MGIMDVQNHHACQLTEVPKHNHGGVMQRYPHGRHFITSFDQAYLWALLT
jgi:hypothetical protein